MPDTQPMDSRLVIVIALCSFAIGVMTAVLFL